MLPRPEFDSQNFHPAMSLNTHEANALTTLMGLMGHIRSLEAFKAFHRATTTQERDDYTKSLTPEEQEEQWNAIADRYADLVSETATAQAFQEFRTPILEAVTELFGAHFRELYEARASDFASEEDEEDNNRQRKRGARAVDDVEAVPTPASRPAALAAVAAAAAAAGAARAPRVPPNNTASAINELETTHTIAVRLVHDGAFVVRIPSGLRGALEGLGYSFDMTGKAFKTYTNDTREAVRAELNTLTVHVPDGMCLGVTMARLRFKVTRSGVEPIGRGK